MYRVRKTKSTSGSEIVKKERQKRGQSQLKTIAEQFQAAYEAGLSDDDPVDPADIVKSDNRIRSVLDEKKKLEKDRKYEWVFDAVRIEEKEELEDGLSTEDQVLVIVKRQMTKRTADELKKKEEARSKRKEEAKKKEEAATRKREKSPSKKSDSSKSDSKKEGKRRAAASPKRESPKVKVPGAFFQEPVTPKKPSSKDKSEKKPKTPVKTPAKTPSKTPLKIPAKSSSSPKTKPKLDVPKSPSPFGLFNFGPKSPSKEAESPILSPLTKKTEKKEPSTKTPAKAAAKLGLGISTPKPSSSKTKSDDKKSRTPERPEAAPKAAPTGGMGGVAARLRMFEQMNKS